VKKGDSNRRKEGKIRTTCAQLLWFLAFDAPRYGLPTSSSGKLIGKIDSSRLVFVGLCFARKASPASEPEKQKKVRVLDGTVGLSPDAELLNDVKGELLQANRTRATCISTRLGFLQ
jgi:hypothetical protein